ncbi:MAG: hypothetical protein IJM30_04095 [Thermoguttaceae bacterium]|nr:hypothetical protein [Thermoguttaceae bacterium]
MKSDLLKNGTARAILRVLRAAIPIVALALFVRAIPASGEEPSATDEASVSERESDVAKKETAFPSFRFWKIPADSIDRWPWGDKKHLPIRIEQFNEWLAISQEIDRLRAEDERAREFATATLSLDARLIGDRLEGRGVYRVRASIPGDDLGFDSTSPLELRDFSFAPTRSDVSSANLLDSVGVYPDGALRLPNSEEKDRSFSWSQRGKSDKGSVSFDFVFPNASRVELRLETPATAKVLSPDGAIESEEDARGAVKTWRVYFGGKPTATLTIEGAGTASTSDEFAVGVRQESSYRIAPEGIELTTRMEFERTEARPDKLTLSLELPLRLVSLEWGTGKEPRFRFLPKREGEDATTLEIDVPKRTENLDELKLTAICPVALDAETKLPRVWFDEGAFFWQETTWRLIVVRPLVASSSVPFDAARARDSRRASAEDAEVFLYKLFSSRGGTTIKLRALRREPIFDSATECSFASPDADATARTTLLFDFSGASSPRATIPLAPDWTIDSVLSSSDEPISWFCDEDPTTKRRVLSISFQRLPSGGRPARVALTARRPAASQGAIEVDKLCPFDLSEHLRGARALSLRAEPPYQIKLSTRSGGAFSPTPAKPDYAFDESELRAAVPSAFDSEPLFFGAQTLGAVVSLESGGANRVVSGTCECGIIFDLDEYYLKNYRVYKFVQRWNLRVEPTSGASLERVVFYASATPEGTVDSDAPWKWSLPGDSEGVRVAPRISKEEFEARGIPKEFGAFEIGLDSPKNSPFDLTIEFESRGSASTQIPLLFFPETNDSSIEIVADSPQRFPFWTKTSGARETTPPVAPPDRREVLKKAFRYDPVVAGDLESDFPRIDAMFEPPADEPVVETTPPVALCWFQELDAFFQEDGGARNRALFYVENRGRDYVSVVLPPDAPFQSVFSIWIDGRKALFSYDATSRTVKIVLPRERRFVCAGIEYESNSPKLVGGAKIVPSAPTCDLPVLSSLWRARTPPRYLTTNRAVESRRAPFDFIKFFSLAPFVSRAPSDEALGAVGDRFMDRFGELIVANRPNSETTEPEADGSRPARAARSERPTWGDAFGSAKSVRALFALDPAVSEPSDATFSLYVDRVAFARLGITPSALPPNPTATSNKDRARRALEESGLVLVFFDERSALATSADALIRAEIDAVPLRGSSVRRFRSPAAARAFRSQVAVDGRSRFVSPEYWSSATPLRDPWATIPPDENAVGWNLTPISLDDGEVEIRVVDRYFLWSLELFCFLAFVAPLWRGGSVSPQFYVIVLGICAALACVVESRWLFPIRGAALGTIFALALRIAFSYASSGRRRKPRKKSLSVKPEPAEIPEAPSDESSVEGFVDFSKMPLEERRRLRGDDGESEARPDGFASLNLLFALAIAVSLVLALASSRAADPPDAAASSSPLESSAASDSEAPSSDSVRRVFVPVDKNYEPTGDYYWIDSEFYEEAREAIRERPRERNWRIVDASYEGGVNYNSAEDSLVLFNLKATYLIAMDGTSATISVPGSSAAPDSPAQFDRQAISSEYDERTGETRFEIDDASPGIHRLELFLAAPQFSEDVSEISIDVPRAPSARLALSCPSDAPSLEVPNARGKVVRSLGWLVAELGAVDKIVLKKAASPDRGAKSTLEETELFLLRPRAVQLDVRAVFKYNSTEKIKTIEIEQDPNYAFSGYCQCDEAEIESVDPPTSQNDTLRVSFREPIEGAFSLRVNFIARGFSGAGRLRFPRVSTRGARTTRALAALCSTSDAMCADFPASSISESTFLNEWGTVDGSVVKAYDLAILPPNATFSARINSETPDVALRETFVFGSTEIEKRCDFVIDARADLFRLSIGTPRPFVVDAISLTDEFGSPLDAPDYFATEDGLVAVFRTPIKGKALLSLTGRTKARVDRPQPLPVFYVKDAATRSRLVRVHCASDVYLEWTPPSDWKSLPRSRVADFGDAPDPDAGLVGVFAQGEATDSENKLGTAERTERAPDGETASRETSIAESTCVVRENAPTFVGEERVVLYEDATQTPKVWRARATFKFSVKGGRADRFLIALDEAFSTEIDDPNSEFEISETTAPNGARALLAIPNKPDVEERELNLDATFKNESESVRLPRFQLLPSSPREDLSKLERFALLPTKRFGSDEKLKWYVYDMRAVPNKRSGDSDISDSESLNRSTKALVDQGTATKAASPDLPQTVADRSYLIADNFDSYIRGPLAGASLSTELDRLSTTRARHSFYANRRGEFFGASSFTIRQSSRDSCVLKIPTNCELVEVRVNGAPRLTERLDGAPGRWSVDLGASPYVKRVDATYRGACSIRSSSRGTPLFDADFVEIEGAPPERVLWTCAFETSEDLGSKWLVSERLDSDLTPVLEMEREPIPFAEADEALFRTAVETAASMLDAYESDLSRFSAETDADASDLPRLRARWDAAWRELETVVALYLEREPSSAGWSERLSRAVFAPDETAEESDGSKESNSALADPFARWTLERYRETMRQKRNLDEQYRVDAKTDASSERFFSPQSLWIREVGASTRVLFGVASGKARGLAVVAEPKPFNFFGSRLAAVLFFVFATPVLARAVRRRPSRSRLGILFSFGAVAVCASLFFVLDWRVPGLIGVFALAIFALIGSSTSRRAYGETEPARSPESILDDDDSSLEPDLRFWRRGDDLSSTADLDVAGDEPSAPSPGSGFPSRSDEPPSDLEPFDDSRGSTDDESIEEPFD